jgi:hypothetical protein
MISRRTLFSSIHNCLLKAVVEGLYWMVYHLSLLEVRKVCG